MGVLGLAYDLKAASPKLIAKRTIRTGDGTRVFTQKELIEREIWEEEKEMNGKQNGKVHLNNNNHVFNNNHVNGLKKKDLDELVDEKIMTTEIEFY